MLKITEKFEKRLEELRKETLRKRIQWAFDTLWYDSSIPDFGTAALQKACDLIAPTDSDSNTILQAKGLLIAGLAGDIFYRNSDENDIAKLEINACVFPDSSRIKISNLIKKQKLEG
jgi:hypothetical protein